MDYPNQYAGNASAASLNRGAVPVENESASKIRDAVSRCETVLSDVHEAISALEQRLDTVLTPQPPKAVSATNPTPQAIASHMLGRLQLHNESLADAVLRLRDTARRVEV